MRGMGKPGDLEKWSNRRWRWQTTGPETSHASVSGVERKTWITRRLSPQGGGDKGQNEWADLTVLQLPVGQTEVCNRCVVVVSSFTDRSLNCDDYTTVSHHILWNAVLQQHRPPPPLQAKLKTENMPSRTSHPLPRLIKLTNSSKNINQNNETNHKTNFLPPTP